jgi:Sulfotransferase domain
MRASDFSGPSRTSFPAWVRYASYVPLYGIALPLVKCLEAFGRWPNVRRRRAASNGANFGDYRPSAGDVIVAAYFKSGTTWLLQMTTQIAFRGQAEFANIHHVVPWPDVPVPPLARLMIPLADPSPLAYSPTGRRVIKTHLRCDEIPFVAQARYIAGVRDPKDVVVSGYHFFKSLILGPLMPSVAHWVDYMMSPNFQGSWAEHLASYWAVRHEPNVLFLTYEEMRKDHAGAVAKLADFMGVALTGHELESVIHQSSFATMKEAGLKFDPGQVLPWTRDRSMVRSGKSGGSSELLTPAQQRQIDDYCRADLKRLGCDFPYDEVYGSRKKAP